MLSQCLRARQILVSKMNEQTLKETTQLMQMVGRDIFLAHLISSHGGNISVRVGDELCITRTGSMLGRLSDTDIVVVPVEGPSERDCEASSELIVHRALYQATNAGAVVHTHSPQTIFRSMLEDSIEPIDSEARLFIPCVNVVQSKKTVGSAEAAQLLAAELSREDAAPLAVLRGHGPFSTGATLLEAYRWVSVLECSCEQLNMRDMMGKPLKDYLG